MSQDPTIPPEPVRKRRWGLTVALVLVGMLTLLGLLAGQGLSTSLGVTVVEHQLNKVKAGRFGQLSVTGLQGHLLSRFQARTVSLRDAKGVWVRIDDLEVAWRPLDLMTRTVHVSQISARQVTVLRRPVLSAPTPKRLLPVNLHLQGIRARVETAPEVTVQRGLFNLTGELQVARKGGGLRSRVKAESLLHAGDRLEAEIDIRKGRPMVLMAEASEARGGALAGGFGFAVDQPFLLKISADGRTVEGRITALARSGKLTPLKADGTWTKTGTRLEGHIDLAASRRTQWLVRRIGSDLRVKLSSQLVDKPFQTLALDLRSDQFHLVAKGAVDIKARKPGPAGLNLTLDANSLENLIFEKDRQGLGLGPAQVTGVLKPSSDGWRLEGKGLVRSLAWGDYGLQSVQGPLSLTLNKAGLDLTLGLSGAGGAGTGFVASRLGARPDLALSASRLKDGRYLIRRLNLLGPGLKVEAEGNRGLLGGLGFKGKAEIASRAGSDGAFTGTWTASQSGPGKAWVLSVDGRGKQLVTGLAELDRILGPSPRLEARGQFVGGDLKLDRMALTGAALDAKGQGQLARDGGVSGQIDWSAEGPFRAGPVEITGKAHGEGQLAGSLAEPRLNLTAALAAIDLPRLPLRDAHLAIQFARRAGDNSGTISLTALSDQGPARVVSAFGFREGGVDLSDLDLQAGGISASGSVSLRRKGTSTANLDLDVGAGALLESGRVRGNLTVVDRATGPTANLDLLAENAILPGQKFAVRRGHLTATGPLARLPYELQADGVSATERWTLSGSGKLDTASPATVVSFDGRAQYGRRDLHTTEQAVLRFDGAGRSARLRLAAADGGTLDLDADMHGKGAEVRMKLVRIGLGLFDADLDGRIDGSLVMTGEGDSLEVWLDAVLDGARGRGSDAALGLDGTLTARINGKDMAVNTALTNRQGLVARSQIVLPVEASAAPFRVAINRKAPLRGHVEADGEVKPLWDLFVGGERELAGTVHLEGTLGGTLSDPKAVGKAQVDRGRFMDGATGLLLQDVSLTADLADNAINISKASGVDGHGGKATGEGRISLEREGESSFRLTLNNFRMIDNDTATAAASGQATIMRNAKGRVSLVGLLSIDRADVAARPPTPSGVTAMDVVEINKSLDLTGSLQPVGRSGDGVALDVSLFAPRRVFLRGRGLDLELSLDAHVGGNTTRPTLNGTARVERGNYEFAGKRFEFDDRGAVYLGSTPKDIRLDLTATRDDPSLTAVVRIKGTAAKPEITLTSQPVLPKDEVLSQVLFGRSAALLTPLEAAQLASALSALAGGGGFDVMGNLRSLARLDRLAVAGGGDTGVTVSGGKYLTDDVYLELTGGGREGPSAQVEWRVGKNLSIISKLASQGDGKLAVRWRKDY